MTDKNSDQGTSERDIIDASLWEKAKSAGMSRRNFLALTALGGSAAVLAACGVDSTPVPSPDSGPAGDAIARVPLPQLGRRWLPLPAIIVP